MSLSLSLGVAELLADQSTVRILATLDDAGGLALTPEPSLIAGENGNVLLLVVSEAAPSHRNLLRALWYDQPVGIALVRAGGVALSLRARPVENKISGPLFTEQYVRLRDRTGEDLASVWVIEVEPVAATDPRTLPPIVHFDRIARAPGGGADAAAGEPG